LSAAKRVGFGPRLVAFIIDSFIIGLLASILMSYLMENTFQAVMKGDFLNALMEAYASGSSGADSESFKQMLKVTSFITHLSMLYMLIEAFNGATPGKMMLGLKIGSEEGNPADTWLYFYRYAVKNSSSLLALLASTTGVAIFHTLGGLLGMVIIFGCFLVLGPRRQAIHDMVAKTAVYYKHDLKG
jgi:uncharacterized RDD family membrane protein YckC